MASMIGLLSRAGAQILTPDGDRLLGRSTVRPWAASALIVNGENIGLSSARLRWVLGDTAATASVTLFRRVDAIRCPPGVAAILQIGGRNWSLLVDSVRLTERAGEADVVLDLVSPCARAQGVTQSWSTSIQATTIAAAVLAPIPVVWRAMDWLVPAGAFASQGNEGREAITRLSACIGAVPIPMPDGSIAITPRWPARPDNLSTIATLTLPLREVISRERQRGYPVRAINRLTISSGPAAAALPPIDVIYDDDRLGATIRAWPPIGCTLTITPTTSNITLIDEGELTYVEAQEIEIVEGRGRLPYPIVGLAVIGWRSAPLTDVARGPADDEVSASGTGLVELQLTSRIQSWRASSGASTRHQMVISNALNEFLGTLLLNFATAHSSAPPASGEASRVATTVTEPQLSIDFEGELEAGGLASLLVWSVSANEQLLFSSAQATITADVPPTLTRDFREKLRWPAGITKIALPRRATNILSFQWLGAAGGAPTLSTAGGIVQATAPSTESVLDISYRAKASVYQVRIFNTKTVADGGEIVVTIEVTK